MSKIQKMMKTVNTEEENFQFLNNFRNFNEIFRSDVTYDNINSYKKTEFHLLSEKYVFGKTTRGPN